MKKHHYVYHSYEEWGREYIGVRSCDCLPEEAIEYFGSFKDKTFSPTEKTILFVCETRKEVAEIEIELHDFFDVSVNPQFANKAKAVSTGFDRTGVPQTEEAKKKISESLSGKYAGENSPMFGVPKTEAQKKAQSERMSGEKHPMYGVPHTEETKKKISVANSGRTRTEAQNKANSERMSGENHPQYGKTGVLSPCSKAIIAIKPDGTELHYWGGHEAARELGINQGSLSKYLKTGKSPKWGKFKGWRFAYKNSTNF